MRNPTLTNIETVALVVDKPGGAFELKPVVFDQVRDDEFLVEMLYSGICHTVQHTSLSSNNKARIS
jgi:Zn-dependent alcohol dehydrogenase